MKNQAKLFLHSLSLHNFATFENQNIVFDGGFNAIVGETGSGKSLILDALQLCFGQRADKKLIRKDAPFASIEAIFKTNCPTICEFLNNAGHPVENDEIVIKRIIYDSGQSKSFLNFQSCSLQQLIQFSRTYVDLVGQFENQKLLSSEYQLLLLDTFADLNSRVANYTEMFHELQQLKQQIADRKTNQEIRNQKIDYLEFQLKELEELAPSVEDEIQLKEEKSAILNCEQEKSAIMQALAQLSENEHSNVLQLLNSVQNQVETLTNNQELLAKITDARQLAEEVSYELARRPSSDEGQQQRLEEIIERLDLYQRLKRKFGNDTHVLIDKINEFQQELFELKNIDDTISKLDAKIVSLSSSALALAKEIHEIRIKNATLLSKKLTQNIRRLMMDNATIHFDLTQTDQLHSFGITALNFMAETNKGEGMFRVKDVASGGELSRILLALRQILSSNDTISVFLFDEIDAGIGGETAICIGKALQEVANNSQVIAITHLPQIANYAQKLIHVSKELEQNGQRTISNITEITGQDKKHHVEKMVRL